MIQNTQKEVEFFDQFAKHSDYDVFNESGYQRLIRRLVALAGPQRLTSSSRVIDLGCGSGAIIRRLRAQFTFEAQGIDISSQLIERAQKQAPLVHFRVGNILAVDAVDASFDVILYSGVLHHFPDMDPVLKEGYRILKPGGCLLAFDPNLFNPAMWLYRAPQSPFYSDVGKTENEILLEASDMRARLGRAGFRQLKVSSLSGVTFRYLESPSAQRFLPLYNFYETLWGWTPFASRYGSFLISYGEK